MYSIVVHVHVYVHVRVGVRVREIIYVAVNCSRIQVRAHRRHALVYLYYACMFYGDVCGM